MNTTTLCSFDRQEALTAKLVRTVTTALEQGIQRRGRASLVVSGGSTPIPLFQALSQTPFAWNRVHVTLADERWVPPDAPESNEQLVRTHLLQGEAATASFVGLKTEDSTPHQAESTVQRRLAALPRPFDLVLLGMGNDGHTASLFPGSPELDHAIAPSTSITACAITPANAPHLRMTQTLSSLLNSRIIFLHLTGAEKNRVYQQALNGTDSAEMPVRAILHQRQTPVTVYWAP